MSIWEAITKQNLAGDLKMVQTQYSMDSDSVKEPSQRKWYLNWELNGVLGFQPADIGKGVSDERNGRVSWQEGKGSYLKSIE